MTCALVLGRAEGVLEDAEKAKALAKIDYVLATGPVACDYPGEIDAWVWYHSELFADRAAKRARNGYPPVKSYWTLKPRGGVGRTSTPGVELNYIDWQKGGSSGLIAVIIALEIYKANRVALAGVPMDSEGGRYDDHKLWPEALRHRAAWTMNLTMLKGRVRSFTGWTREILGGEPPTAEWMSEVADATAA